MGGVKSNGVTKFCGQGPSTKIKFAKFNFTLYMCPKILTINSQNIHENNTVLNENSFHNRVKVLCTTNMYNHNYTERSKLYKRAKENWNFLAKNDQITRKFME